MSVEPQDLQLKYAGTVLIVHVYIRATQDVARLQKQVVRAAGGPRRDALAAWTEICAPGQELGVEAEKFGDQRAMVEQFLRSSTGEVVVFHLCVNTDAHPRRLGENIQRAARGPRLDDVMCVIEHYDGNAGREVWDLIQQVARRAHADPAARTVTL